MKNKITFEHDKQFNERIKKHLEELKVDRKIRRLAEFGQEGVDALQAATPVLTGKTANSWYYEITNEEGKVSLTWFNTNINNGVNVAIIIDHGHATLDGSWFEGYHYIDSAIEPIIVKINNYFKEGGSMNATVRNR